MADCCEVVCPKPRRVAPLNLNTISRFHMRNDSESNHGADLLGLILRQDYNESLPFSFGSPPSRTQNPVVHDADFWVEKLTFDSSCEQFTNLGKKQAANRSRLQGF
ncbi:uncharacterized protein LOC125224424 [Salvia hispanica]|uniref:uncharacterized protein LOC125224424 n=1 Tax=Salvia hispanica TaxID=49212 RepID=UPI002009AC9E|nr:uncharacterized protein LOC125224424 [Salvia hispanica]